LNYIPGKESNPSPSEIKQTRWGFLIMERSAISYQPSAKESKALSSQQADS